VGTLLVVGLIFAAAGVFFTVIGIRTSRSNRRFQATAARATATVTEVRTRSVGSAGDSTLVFIPVVRFQTADGRTVDAEAGGGTNRKRWSEGDAIGVLYDPSNPGFVKLDASGSGFITGMLLAFGGLFTLLGLALVGLAVAVG
jgi:hypothetical protein